MIVPPLIATPPPSPKSYSSLVVNGVPGRFFDETPSIIRTSNIVPAGTVIVLGCATGAGAGAGATGAGAAAAADGVVNVRAMASAVSMTWVPPLVSNRTVPAVPP